MANVVIFTKNVFNQVTGMGYWEVPKPPIYFL